MMSGGHNDHGLWTVISLPHPKSTGVIKLKSKDPFDHPMYLKVHDDLEKLVTGIRIWEKLMETPSMKRLGVKIEQLSFILFST